MKRPSREIMKASGGSASLVGGGVDGLGCVVCAEQPAGTISWPHFGWDTKYHVCIRCIENGDLQEWLMQQIMAANPELRGPEGSGQEIPNAKFKDAGPTTGASETDSKL